jgi:hypothetical protein
VKLDDKTLARFWAKVDQRRDDECWPWTGTVGPSGYGSFNLVVRPRRVMSASRVALQLSLGREMGPLELACHHCDNTLCCNPAHLFAGSQKANIQDAVSKARMHKWAGTRRGAGNPKAKLTESDVRSIKRALASGVRQIDLARDYRVGFSTIAEIKSGRNWGHIQ